MPYSSVEELPPAVKELPDTKQRQWMHVWNSAFSSCEKAGGEGKACEEKAFAQAWGVVKKDAEVLAREIPLRKLDAPRGLFYGVVYSPGEVDAHGDFTTAEEIERAAHDFLPEAVLNLNHAEDLQDVQVVESYIAPVDFVVGEQKILKGSWIIVSRVVNEELKKAIMCDEVTGYSMEGTAIRMAVV